MNNDFLEYKGKKYSKKELANLFGIKYGTFIAKLSRGWTLEEIENGYRNNSYTIEINGIKYKSKKDACDKLGISYRQLNNKLNNINTKYNKKITINGITYKSKKEAKEKLNCSTYTLNKLINNQISNVEKVKYIIDNKEFSSKKDIAKHYNINYDTFLNKLNLGWTIEQVIGLENPPEKIDINKINIDKLSKENNIDKETIIKKLKKGYVLEKAIMPFNNKNIKITCNGSKFNSIAEMAKYYKKPVKLIYNRLNIGWTPEEAVELIKRKK